MPLSKARDRERKKAERAKKKARGAILMPKAIVRQLRRLGVDPRRHLMLPRVSLDDYRALLRQLEAKAQRVEWQSSGIRQLWEEIARLKALLATQPAMQDGTTLQRMAALEADQALHEAMHGVSTEAP